ALARPESYDLPAVAGAQEPRPAAGSEWQEASPNHDTKFLVVLGQSGALVSLASRRRDHRLDRLWLVDEPHPGAPGSFLLPLDPCRYRLSRAAADDAPPDLARPQSDAGLACRHTA